MKKIIYVFIVAISIFNLSYAGCGSCNVSGKKADSPEGNFITSIGKKGNIDGLVLASCGMCNFGMKNKKRCNLAIQINDEAYDVKGTGIDDHGDSHAKDGYCNVIKKVYVEGRVRGKTFKANKMEFPSI